KTGEYKLALPLLLQTAPANSDWTAWLAGLGSKQRPPAEEELTRIAALPKGGESAAWTREWLYYVARSQTAADNLLAAEAACTCLVQRLPKADETCDAIWALAGRFAKVEKKAQAIEWYKRLDETNAEHSRADDALFAVMELQRGDKEIHTYVNACQHLAERHPDSALLGKAWYGVGLAHEKAGEAKAAADAFAEATKQIPGDFYVHRALARLPNREGRLVPV
ncbi:MAG: hypothetical protein NTU83_00780, partial [Candidatus Hydrogenedentes bacterium]|nr:hypothetical protein [Candidatus Hydrogenedentota bacterium]